MKKAVFSFIFLVHTCSLISFNLSNAVNVGSALLTGGPSAGASAAFAGAVGGEEPQSYDMGGFDPSAGDSSGTAAFDLNGYAPLSDVQAAQMREIASTMPGAAPVAGYTDYSPPQQPTYASSTPTGTFDPGYPEQTAVPVSTDFFSAAPVDYSLPQQMPPGTQQTSVQQFDAMGNPILPTLTPLPGTQQTVYPTTPSGSQPTIIIQTPSAPIQAPNNQNDDSSGLDQVGGAGGVIGIAGAGVIATTAGGYKIAKTTNSKDELTLSPGKPVLQALFQLSQKKTLNGVASSDLLIQTAQLL